MNSSIPSTQDIENRFTYHKPFGNQPERYQTIRTEAKRLAHTIDDACPNSREKSLALTKLEEAVMWANASIARNEACDQEQAQTQTVKTCECKNC